MGKKFQVTNATRKPVDIDPRTRRDRRKVLDRVGYAVSFTSTEGMLVKTHTLGPTSGPAIISDLNEGLLKLYRGGIVDIVEIPDIAVMLKRQTLTPQDSPGRVVAPNKAPLAPPSMRPQAFGNTDPATGQTQPAAQVNPATGHPGAATEAASEKAFLEKQAQPRFPQKTQPVQKASAVEMGKDDHGASKQGTGEYPGATNPDGPPNFAVTAAKGGQKLAAQRKAKKVAGKDVPLGGTLRDKAVGAPAQ